MEANRLIVAGGGAAGFFGAITAAENGFDGEIILLEKSTHLLSKVLVSGGGRCNVTHACFENDILVQHYPRGNRELKGPFSYFNTADICAWFEKKGVTLKTEHDGRIFPQSNRSSTIADCLLETANKNNIKIRTQCAVTAFEKKAKFLLDVTNHVPLEGDYLLIATGGHPKAAGYSWIGSTGHQIVPPVPSLFTFNIPDSSLQGLEGISVPDAEIKITGAPHESRGPLLITHWGISGPAVLKLSAWAARKVHEMNYDFEVIISFFPDMDENEIKALLVNRRIEHPQKKICSDLFMMLPQRLWQRLAELAGVDDADVWGQLKKEKQQKLTAVLLGCKLLVRGKTTFKEEFVTCGGIDLAGINMRTMESRKIQGLYFAGELINIDGVTGGFNFQNAWTTGYLAGKSIVEDQRKRKSS